MDTAQYLLITNNTGEREKKTQERKSRHLHQALALAERILKRGDCVEKL